MILEDKTFKFLDPPEDCIVAHEACCVRRNGRCYLNGIWSFEAQFSPYLCRPVGDSGRQGRPGEVRIGGEEGIILQRKLLVLDLIGTDQDFQER